MSLVSVMMAVAITGMLAVIGAQLMKNQFAAQKAVVHDSEVEEIRRMLRARLSCSETRKKWTVLGINPATCLGTAPLYDVKGNLLISNNAASATKVGPWTLRALCRNAATGDPATDMGFEIQAAKVRPGVINALHSVNPADFVADPLRNGVVLDWWSVNTRKKKGYATGSSLYMKESRPCSEIFETAGGGDPPQPVDCIVVNTSFARAALPINAALWRTSTVTCPNSQPFAMSSSIGMSCNSGGWNANTVMGASYPRTALCSDHFYRDSDAPGTPLRIAKDNSCATLGGDPESHVCSVVCCQFEK